MTVHQAQGYRTLSECYLLAAKHLLSARTSGDLILPFDAPIYATLAHALELAIKAHLLENGFSKEQLKDLGHCLSNLFQELPNNVSTELREGIRQRWKATLRQDRDTNRDNLRAKGFEDPAILREFFGDLDNGEIGAELPSLNQALTWLDNRHTKDGSQFRYFAPGIDWKPQISRFGKTRDVVSQSTIWAIELLLNTPQID